MHRGIRSKVLSSCLLLLFGIGCGGNSGGNRDGGGGDGGQGDFTTDIVIDNISVFNQTQLTRGAAGWELSLEATSHGAMYAAPALEASLQRVTESGVYWEDADWLPVAGLAETTVTLPSSAQTITYDPVFGAYSGRRSNQHDIAAGESVTFSGNGVNETVTIPVQPPGLTVVGTPAGMDTEVRIPDGTFEYVQIEGGYGNSGYLSRMAHDAMTLEGGDRVATLIEAPVKAELEARSLFINQYRILIYNVVTTADLSDDGRPVELRVGWVFFFHYTAVQ